MACGFGFGLYRDCARGYCHVMLRALVAAREYCPRVPPLCRTVALRGVTRGCSDSGAGGGAPAVSRRPGPLAGSARARCCLTLRRRALVGQPGRVCLLPPGLSSPGFTGRPCSLASQRFVRAGRRSHRVRRCGTTTVVIPARFARGRFSSACHQLLHWSMSGDTAAAARVQQRTAMHSRCGRRWSSAPWLGMPHCVADRV